MVMAHTRRMALWMRSDEVNSEPSQSEDKKQRISNDNPISGSLYSLYLVCDFFLSFLLSFIFPWPCLFTIFLLLFLSLLGRRSLICISPSKTLEILSKY
jgi:hypothetical protein